MVVFVGFVLFNACSTNLFHERNSLLKKSFSCFLHIKTYLIFFLINKNQFFVISKIDLIFFFTNQKPIFCYQQNGSGFFFLQTTNQFFLVLKNRSNTFSNQKTLFYVINTDLNFLSKKPLFYYYKIDLIFFFYKLKSFFFTYINRFKFFKKEEDEFINKFM